MNTAKFSLPVALLIALYLVLFASDMPREIEFQGQTLGPRERIENNSRKPFDIYSYSDSSRHHVLLFVMATESAPTSQELLEFYVNNFKASGFSFRNTDGRYLGTKGNEVIYMGRAPRIDSAIAYIQKDANAPTGFREASGIFSELESYSLD